MTARLVVAGTASGVGKTTVVVALARALRQRGLRVATFKCGPDYLDPTYHARASDGVSHNLDGWMMGQEAVRATFARAQVGADIALIEGVMGLYDGAAADDEAGSAAEVAKWLEAPVVAVVDASGIARTLAALGVGLRDFDRSLRLVGLCANRVGSRGHLELLKQACRAAVPVVGGLPKDDAHPFASRHLGLLTADREAVPEALFDHWAATFAAWNDLDAWLALARSAPAWSSPPPAAPVATPRCRIGVARDAAFHFYYDDNLARLESLGAELVFFSPLHDATLPALDGLYLGGGYPEAHAPALAGNERMRLAVRALAASGAPIYAECGGLLYLSEALVTPAGRFDMVGLVPGTAVMHDRLQALGYVEVETQERTLLGGAGLRFRGHQFRYSTLEGGQPHAYRVRRRRGGETVVEGYGRGNLLASYVHAHWASNPLVAEGLVAAACRQRASVAGETAAAP